MTPEKTQAAVREPEERRLNRGRATPSHLHRSSSDTDVRESVFYLRMIETSTAMSHSLLPVLQSHLQMSDISHVLKGITCLGEVTCFCEAQHPCVVGSVHTSPRYTSAHGQGSRSRQLSFQRPRLKNDGEVFLYWRLWGGGRAWQRSTSGTVRIAALYP